MKEAVIHNKGAVLLRLFATTLPDVATPSAGDSAGHPDEALLTLCNEALRSAHAADEARGDHGSIPHWSEHERVAWETAHAARMAAYRKACNDARRIVVQAVKLPATTPAGIFAKAVLMRCSVECAGEMAMSLAADLLEDGNLFAGPEDFGRQQRTEAGRTPQRAVAA